MASIINQVSFHNFFNYFGSYEQNEYDFTDGVNIVIADNGAGKSKFFNAFMWLFYDDVLDSDTKKKVQVKSFAVKMISDKAKAEASIGDIIECGVKIQYSDNRYKYQITKSLRAKKLGNSITESRDWQVFVNEMEVSKRDIILLTYHPVYDEDEKTKILNKLIQLNLRPYSLFQGEEVDKLIDFSDPKAIKKAVTTLTSINKYEDAKEITTYISKRAEESLNRKIEASTEDTANYDKIIKDQNDKRESLSHEEEKYKRFEQSFNENKSDVEKLEALNENAEKRKVYDDKLKELNLQLGYLKEEYELLTSKINSRFFDGNFAWLGLGCEKFVEIFKNKNNSYTENHVAYKLDKLNQSSSNKVSLLPVGSPDPITVRTMIEKEFCYVCNRDAKRGTAPYTHLVSLLDRPSKSVEIEVFKNDLGAFFSDIMVGSQPFISRMASVHDSVRQTRLKEKELNEKIKSFQLKIKDQRDKRSHLIIGEEDSDASSQRAIMSQYRGAVSRMDRAKVDMETSAEKVAKIKRDLNSLGDEIGKMGASIKDVPNAYKINYSFAFDLKNAAERTRTRVYKNMLDNLERAANNHFSNLIKYNDTKGGRLKFVNTSNDTIEFFYIDKVGNEVSGASEGFQRMKVLSVLMAIISVTKTGYEYPLLADAPLAAFGQGFIKGFFEETAKVFPQSIILIKDLYDKTSPNKISLLGQELLSNTAINTVYLNEIPENLEQIDRYTTKKKVK
jgi:DNA sulfur modification protein DndD